MSADQLVENTESDSGSQTTSPPPPTESHAVIDYQEFQPVQIDNNIPAPSITKKGKGKAKKNAKPKIFKNDDEDYELLVDYIANADLDEFKDLENSDLASILSVADGSAVLSGYNSDGDPFVYWEDDESVSDDDQSCPGSEDGEGLETLVFLDLGDNPLEGLKNMTLGPRMSKSQQEKFLKEALKDKVMLKRSLKRAPKATDLAEIISLAKEYTDPAVLEYLNKENERIRDFVRDPQCRAGDSLVLPLLPGPIRKIVYTLSAAYNLKYKSQGKKVKKKVATLFKNKRSSVPLDWASLVEDAISGEVSLTKSKKTKKGKKVKVPEASMNMPKKGDIVGANAKPIPETNIGHKLLQSMGWSPGDSLGDGVSGLKEPVQVVIRSRRGGLGMA